jgi:1-phosphofructokinase family hexose kinase
MILTVTANTAIDKVLFIDEWLPGSVMRTSKVVTSVGGKGLDSSVVLRHLGVETVGMAFVAGQAGRELAQIVEGYGIIPEWVWTGGETRTANVIVERRHNRHSHVIAGDLSITPAQAGAYLERFRLRVPEADWVICAGSVPGDLSLDFYRDIAELSRQAGVPALIDTTGPPARRALLARPAIVKMNWDEFQETFTVEAKTRPDRVDRARAVFEAEGLEALVITAGRDGILAFSREGAFHAQAPVQPAVNAAGAGDAVSAALAWRFAQGDSWRVALQWAGAVSAAVVLTEGTADCRMEDIRRIFPQVRVEAQ